MPLVSNAGAVVLADGRSLLPGTKPTDPAWIDWWQVQLDRQGSMAFPAYLCFTPTVPAVVDVRFAAADIFDQLNAAGTRRHEGSNQWVAALVKAGSAARGSAEHRAACRAAHAAAQAAGAAKPKLLSPSAILVPAPLLLERLSSQASSKSVADKMRSLLEAATQAAGHAAPAAEARAAAMAAAVAAAPEAVAPVLYGEGANTGVLQNVKLAGDVTFTRLLSLAGTFYCLLQVAAAVPQLPQQQTDPEHPVRQLSYDG